ncbi:hypothetical protein KAZ66_01990, partial [Candidatus Woesebacteria bacterium]|nr:hypothetical protein [Candidatus Woesebacteria bacterium]
MTKRLTPWHNESVNKKSIVVFLTLAVVFLTSYVPQSKAQSPAYMPAQETRQILPSQPFGQTQAYSVTLRGNQEAVVSMKAIFTNYEEATMSALTFQVPKGEIQNISAYQVVIEPQCIRYVQEPLKASGIEKVTPNFNEGFQQKCVQYSDPDYYQGYYGNMQYMKAVVNSDGKTIDVSLPTGVSPQKSGSIVLYYRATGYVKKDVFGAFLYSFETLKSDTTVRSLSVGVNTDSDLILEGTDQQVNYDTVGSAAPLLARDTGMKQDSFMSAEFDSYYQQIGYGRVTKTSADLQPFDSFTVEGRYAKSQIQLYGKRYTVGGLLALGGLIFIGYIVYRLYRNFVQNRVSQNQKAPSSSGNAVLLMLGMGLLSSVGSALYTIFIYVFFTMLQRSYYLDMSMIIGLFALLISCIIYIVLVFGPTVFVGWKRGVWWGVGTLGVTLVLICIYTG